MPCSCHAAWRGLRITSMVDSAARPSVLTLGCGICGVLVRFKVCGEGPTLMLVELCRLVQDSSQYFSVPYLVYDQQSNKSQDCIVNRVSWSGGAYRVSPCMMAEQHA